jgi:D,D-heptose 1,7-bisphosphate phosphatase
MVSALPRQCAILVGGMGTRLGALTSEIPKPLLDCGGKPFVWWLTRELSRFGIDEVLLLSGHLHGRVAEFAADASRLLPKSVRVRLSREPAAAGTGGAIWHARDLLDEKFLLVNGDSLFDANLASFMANAPTTANSLAHALLRETDDVSRYGIAQLYGRHILSFKERPSGGGSGLINAGIYVMRREVLNFIEPTCSLERDILPKLAQDGLLTGDVATGYFIDIGTPEDYLRAAVEIPRRLRRPAVFFDRDGVLNEDSGWVGSIERFRWIEGAQEAVRAVTDAGFHAFVVTNQAGVARGYYAIEDVERLHRWMIDEIRTCGGTIDDLRYCPDHPDASSAQFGQKLHWRKPEPGMIVDLESKWEIDLQRSFLIGDKQSDLDAARNAGIPGYLFTGGDVREFVSQRLSSA